MWLETRAHHMIILFTAGGRTGNQLFQLSYAMSKRKANEWLVTFDFGKTRELLSSDCKKRWVNLDSRLLRSFAETFTYQLIKIGLISSHSDTEGLYDLRHGKIRWITIMKGYFESSRQHAAGLARIFRLKESLRHQIRPFLAAMLHGRVPIFIHLRRTDLKDLAKDANDIKRMLPDRYYMEAIRIFLKRSESVFYVVVGDDPDHADALFTDIGPKFVSRLSAPEDLALMSLCEGGVLSNSTFAWWGAFFGGGRFGYVVPKYWSGFEKMTWYPPEIRASFMTDFVDVS
jgi:hypothetical protein